MEPIFSILKNWLETSFDFICVIGIEPKWKKNLVNKNQRGEPIHQTYKANENTSKHNPKKKQKQTINKNQINTLCKEDS
jgi:hypothetical protein